MSTAAEGGDGAAPAFGVTDSTMPDVVEKLKLLQYETRFCPLVKPPFKPLTRTYFSGPSTIDNANMQFYYFTSLCAWLMGLCGVKMDPPDQFDDPNASATTVLSELRAMRLPVTGLAPNRIKQGHGEAVVTILSLLVDEALSRSHVQLGSIDYSGVEKYDENAAVVDGDDDVADVDIEDNIVVDSDDEDEVYIGAATAAAARTDAVEAEAVPIKSTINADEWNLEVERVAPLLFVRPTNENDWRSRIEKASVLLKAIDNMYPPVKQMLDRLHEDMSKSREHIQKREQTLAEQFTDHVEEYRVKLRELNSARDSVDVASQSIQQLTSELSQITETIDQIKQDSEEHENKISDTTPMMRIKKAVLGVQDEIKQMALRAGVLQHHVLHYMIIQSKAKRDRVNEDVNDLKQDNMDYALN